MTVTTEVYYNGNGSQTQFTFSFDYIDQDHVKVAILNDATGLYDEKAKGDATYGWSLANANTVEFNTAPPPPTGTEPNIKIYRETDSDAPYAVFTPGSPIKAVDLNDNFEQGIYIAQESATVSARAEEVVVEVEALAIQTKAIADQAAADSSAALTTAQGAETTANAADSNATTALSTANTALSTANTAISDSASALSLATSANNTAGAAFTSSTQALDAANAAEADASTALTAATTAEANAATALSTANTANTNASTALSTANTALSDSATAISTANAAADVVSQAVIFEQVANVAAIPASPVDTDAVSVVDSTGIESFTPLTGIPAGFVGDPGLKVNITYSGTTTSWVWISYQPNDPDSRYLNPSDQAELVQRDGSVPMTGSLTLPGGGGATQALQKQEVEGLISAIPAPGNGAIQINGGTGITASGSNATANQSGGTTRILSLDTSYTDGRYVRETGDTMTGNLTVPSLNSGQLAGFRNLIINGSLTINQRSLDVASVAIGQYGQDRWKRVSGGMTQIIESGNFWPGVTYTLSGIGVTTQQLVAPSSGNWTLPTISTSARLVQLEQGTAATPFEMRPYGIELLLCQRYYLRVNAEFKFDGMLQPGGTGGITVGYTWFFPCSMRTTPSLATVQETQINAGAISGWTAKPSSCALGLFEWLNSGSVISRAKAAIVEANAEL